MYKHDWHNYEYFIGNYNGILIYLLHLPNANLWNENLYTLLVMITYCVFY